MTGRHPCGGGFDHAFVDLYRLSVRLLIQAGQQASAQLKRPTATRTAQDAEPLLPLALVT